MDNFQIKIRRAWEWIMTEPIVVRVLILIFIAIFIVPLAVPLAIGYFLYSAFIKKNQE